MADKLTVQLRQLPGNQDLPLPAYQTKGAVGMDLYAAISEPITLNPGERAAIPTGIAVAIPPGYEGQVRARSGLARRQGVALVNAPGTVDSDYRGEIQVILINLGQLPITLHRGDRIAQIIIAPVIQAEWEVVEELEGTERGDAGFGSTGGVSQQASGG